MQIGTSGPQGNGTKLSDQSHQAEDRFGGLAETSFIVSRRIQVQNFTANDIIICRKCYIVKIF